MTKYYLTPSFSKSFKSSTAIFVLDKYYLTATNFDSGEQSASADWLQPKWQGFRVRKGSIQSKRKPEHADASQDCSPIEKSRSIQLSNSFRKDSETRSQADPKKNQVYKCQCSDGVIARHRKGTSHGNLRKRTAVWRKCGILLVATFVRRWRQGSTDGWDHILVCYVELCINYLSHMVFLFLAPTKLPILVDSQ